MQASEWRRWTYAGAIVMALGCSEPHFAPRDGGDESLLDPRDEGETRDPDPETHDAAAESGFLGDAGVATTEAGLAARPDARVAAVRDAGRVDGEAARASDGGSGETDARAGGPMPGDDAGAPSTPSDPLPAWTSQLPGDYAVEGFTFSEDLGVMIRWRVLWLAQVARVGDAYEAQLTLCDVTASSSSGSSSGASKLNDAPPRRHRIDIKDEMFDVMPIEVAQGYDERPPPQCEGKVGMSVPARDFQTWTTGKMCRCSVDAIPKSQDDCRVTDPDADGRPGITGTARALGTSFTMWGVSAVRSGLVQGRIGADRKHTALYQVNESFERFGCEGGALCRVSAAPVDCTTEHHPVNFSPLDAMPRPPAGWSCATVLERSRALFPAAPPAFPARCAKP